MTKFGDIGLVDLDSNEPARERSVQEALEAPKDQPRDRDLGGADFDLPGAEGRPNAPHTVGRARSRFGAPRDRTGCRKSAAPAQEDDEDSSHSPPGHRASRHRESVLPDDGALVSPAFRNDPERMGGGLWSNYDSRGERRRAPSRQDGGGCSRRRRIILQLASRSACAKCQTHIVPRHEGHRPCVASIVGNVVAEASTPDGALLLSFSDGSVLRCEPDPNYEAWQVVGGWPQYLVVLWPRGRGGGLRTARISPPQPRRRKRSNGSIPCSVGTLRSARSPKTVESSSSRGRG